MDDRWVRWLFVPAVVFISQATNDAYLSDFWHHLARGQEMVRTGRLLDRDIFTYMVPGRAFLDVNWLTQIAYFHLYSWGGLELVRTVNALMLAGAWAGIVGICKRTSGSLEIAMAVGLATFLGAWQVLTIRPQTVSIVLFVGLYDVLLRAEKDWRWLLLAPVFLALWANVHGAFPAGVMLIGMFTAGRFMDFWAPLARRDSRRRGAGGEGEANPLGESTSQPVARDTGSGGAAPLTSLPSPPGVPGGEGRGSVAIWIFASAACAAATLVNPYGFEVYEYARHTSGISARRGIEEWLPPSWDQGAGVAFFMSLPVVIGVLGWSWWKGRRVSWREAFLLACFGLLAGRSIRMVLWWLIIVAPMIAVRLADWWPRSRQVTYAPSRAALLTVIGLVAVCMLSLPPLHAFNPLLKLRSANEETANLEKAFQLIAAKGEEGNVFTKLEWGEYLGWRGGSKRRVNVDGRIEIYPDDVWDKYVAETKGRAVVENARYLILDQEFHTRAGMLKEKQPRVGDWELIGEFGRVLVFRRVEPLNDLGSDDA